LGPQGGRFSGSGNPIPPTPDNSQSEHPAPPQASQSTISIP